MDYGVSASPPSDEGRKETYSKTKKRLSDYRYRSIFLTLGTMVFVVLFIFSLVPIVPAIIATVLGLLYGDWLLTLWFLCMIVFGILFWAFQKSSQRIEGKRGITLEEKMYVPAYEALCFLKEYLDPNHPIISSRTKAIMRLQNLDYMLERTGLPNMAIFKQDIVQLSQLRGNLKFKLIPSVKKASQSDRKGLETLYSVVEGLVDYLSEPELTALVDWNNRMLRFPWAKERGTLESFVSLILRRSNLRHTGVFSIFGVVALFVYYLDINNFGAPMSAAFELALMFFVGMVAIYMTYLGLTNRREPRTSASDIKTSE